MLRPFLRRLTAVSLLGLVAFATAAEAMPERPTEGGSIPAAHERSEELFAQGGGCSAAAAQAAAQTGGQVLSVRASQQGDRTVCVVTVLIPASDGNRPRRQTITIEQ
jgi:putative hemolysin